MNRHLQAASLVANTKWTLSWSGSTESPISPSSTQSVLMPVMTSSDTVMSSSPHDSSERNLQMTQTNSNSSIYHPEQTNKLGVNGMEGGYTFGVGEGARGMESRFGMEFGSGAEGSYTLVQSDVCLSGYSPVSSETECEALVGQTVSNVKLSVLQQPQQNPNQPSHFSSDRGETPGVYADVTKALRFIDWAARSIEKPDPCNPFPCESGTMCMTNKFENPIYRCLGKFVPKPDTINGRLSVFRPKRNMLKVNTHIFRHRAPIQVSSL